ncbi:Lactate utilization protein A [Methanosarcinaceae archaeon Ag5]|uniref:Lactate utilization protein A n=1 Tax=Methanolapillus africanus TaxID=3028297 RepID=A0AAE4MIK1_9EURY|nr:Lactate utilization protein A [Methanosarcinaceae archaeon Ag5]
MDILQKYMLECDLCGACVDVCPSYNDLGIITDLYDYLEESAGPELLPRNEHDIRMCYTCNICTVSCPKDLGIRKLIAAAREKKTKQFGKSEEQGLADPFAPNNMYHKIGDWEPPVTFKNEGKKSDVIYFPGCAASCMNKVVGKSTVKVMDACGVDYSVMSGVDFCCGSVSFGAGNPSPLQKIGQKNIDEINRRGAKVLVTTCPGCYRAFKIIYPMLFGELEFDVLQTSEYLMQLVQKNKLVFKRDMKEYLTQKGLIADSGRDGDLVLYYQDPCHLTRAVGMHEAPRLVLEAVPNVSLSNPTPENSACCGFGGGVRTVFPEKSLEQAAQIHEMAKAAGSDAIITNCGGCMKNIIEGGMNANGLPVFDLAEFISLACGNPATERDDEKLVRLSNKALIHCLSRYDFDPYGDK